MASQSAASQSASSAKGYPSSTTGLSSKFTTSKTSRSSVESAFLTTSTVTKSSSVCVLTLQGQVSDKALSAATATSVQNYITLNSSCAPETKTQPSSQSALRTTVTVTPTGLSTIQLAKHHDALSNGAIAGIAIAIVVVITLVAGIAGCLWWRRRRLQLNATVNPESPSHDLLPCHEKDGSDVSEMPEDRAAVETGEALAHELESPTSEVGSPRIDEELEKD